MIDRKKLREQPGMETKQDDPFLTHEALHTAHLLAESVDEWLCEHPAIKGRVDWSAKAEQARDLLGALYQAIGAAHL